MDETPKDDSQESGAANTRLFQIEEADLAELERLLPVVCEHCYPLLKKNAPESTRLRKQFHKLKEIVSNVRWNNGLPADVDRIEAGGGD